MQPKNHSESPEANIKRTISQDAGSRHPEWDVLSKRMQFHFVTLS